MLGRIFMILDHIKILFKYLVQTLQYGYYQFLVNLQIRQMELFGLKPHEKRNDIFEYLQSRNILFTAE